MSSARFRFYSPVAFALCCLALLLPEGVGATPPVDERPPSLEEREFIPRAGYVRTSKLLNMRRSAGRMAAPAAVTVLNGVRRVPVILLSFKNTEAPFEETRYQDLLFGTSAPGEALRLTMTQYYRDVSHGRFEVTGDVYGWFKLPEEDVFYENGDNGAGKPFGDLLEFGLRKLDEKADLGQYDNDGPDGVPNSGDDDGKVDTVFFIHPEAGAECQSEDVLDNVWSHSWHYSEPTYERGKPFESKDVQRAKAPQGKEPGTGPAKLKSDGSEAHILVEDYTIQPGLSCASTEDDERIVEIGVFCHEYGHALGLPDLYDRTPKTPDSAGVGFWCLMAAGSYGGVGASGAAEPVSLSPWCKQFLGWASVTSLEEGGAYTFEPVEDRGLVYRVEVPGTGEKEYFLVELRDREWSDADGRRHNWDRGLPTSGIAIWHVDEQVGADQTTWPFTPHDKGQNDAPSRPNAVKHSLVALLQADRKQQLEWNKGRGDAGDVWSTGSVFGDDQEMLAGTRGYNGKVTGITLTNLDLSNRKFEFQLESATDQVASSAAPVPSPGTGVVMEVANPAAGMRMQDAAVGGAEAHRRTSGKSASSARTAVLTRTSTTSTSVEREIVELLREAKSEKAEVQVAPEGDRVQRITGLNLPAEKQSVQEDAKHRIEHELSGLLGSGVDLAAKKSVTDAAWNRQIFEQVFEEGGRVLPIFEAETTLFYDGERRLAAMVAETYPKNQMRVTGQAGGLTSEEAKKVVQTALGLDWSVLTGVREGIFLVNGEPGDARVAYQVGVAAGDELKDIQVYVDSETRTILSIQ